MADLCETKIEEDKINSILWLGLNKRLKIVMVGDNGNVHGRCYVESKNFSLIQ